MKPVTDGAELCVSFIHMGNKLKADTLINLLETSYKRRVTAINKKIGTAHN